MNIRLATAADRADIRTVDVASYARLDEALLAERLRAEGDALAELVALDGETIAGHILCARLTLETADSAPRDAALLAILGVLPEARRRGFGAALVEIGLDACRAAEAQVAVVLGPPAYFPRFGFSAEAARHLSAPFSGRSFMALELKAGALAAPARLRYPAAFGFG